MTQLRRSDKLLGVRAVVTGSTRGLGLAFAGELAAHGARVVVNGRDAEACTRAVKELTATNAQVIAVPGSVADVDTAERLVDTCVAEFGGIEVLVNNAGIIRDRTLTRMSPDEFDDVVAVHLRGTWATSRAAATAMRARGGAIINIVSGSALYGLIGQCNYAAAKGGILALTRALSVELARYRIRVNALYPAALTGMTESVLGLVGDQSGSPAVPAFEPPERVAPVVAYLASREAEDLTGQVLSFDGRELTVWSHPAPVHSVRRDTPWSVADVADVLDDGQLPPQPLNPDALGLAVRAALAAR